jgi:hypothetical protein
MVLTDIMSKEQIISLFSYPKNLRLFHLWMLGIMYPSKQHAPFLSEAGIYKNKITDL